MIDARTQHAPANAPGLIVEAMQKASSQRELAARLGVSPRYLQLLAKGDKSMSYTLQVTLEAIVRE